jgi:hypothetical protein
MLSGTEENAVSKASLGSRNIFGPDGGRIKDNALWVAAAALWADAAAALWVAAAALWVAAAALWAAEAAALLEVGVGPVGLDHSTSLLLNSAKSNTHIKTKPTVSDPDPDWIRILTGQWIRIQIRNLDPGG